MFKSNNHSKLIKNLINNDKVQDILKLIKERKESLKVVDKEYCKEERVNDHTVVIVDMPNGIEPLVCVIGYQFNRKFDWKLYPIYTDEDNKPVVSRTPIPGHRCFPPKDYNNGNLCVVYEVNADRAIQSIFKSTETVLFVMKEVEKILKEEY